MKPALLTTSLKFSTIWPLSDSVILTLIISTFHFYSSLIALRLEVSLNIYVISGVLHCCHGPSACNAVTAPFLFCQAKSFISFKNQLGLYYFLHKVFSYMDYWVPPGITRNYFVIFQVQRSQSMRICGGARKMTQLVKGACCQALQPKSTPQDLHFGEN